MIEDAILRNLNESQRDAVVYNEGPSLVIAGAGSGKTRVLTYKIAYLLSNGMKPWNIMALTFTNKAAKEMRERVDTLVGEGLARRLCMGTFHSVFSRILRSEASGIGYTSNYTIYDESDSRSLIKSIVKGMALDEKKYKPSTIASRISMAKNCLILPEAYREDRNVMARDYETGLTRTCDIYMEYQSRLACSNVMDFDDLLVNTYLLFRNHPEVLKKYQELFQFILVDEYQDTNSVQQMIVMQLAAVHHRVCVVGDDAQSIYAFRGANIDNILNFQHQMPETRLFKLEQNYRSTQTIVEAANSLIRHNRRQIPKTVFSKEGTGDKILYKTAYSDIEEAMIVCREIQRIKHTDGCEYGDFAILYRTNAQSRAFEEQMRKTAIPYRIYSGLSFYQRKEIKDAIAYMRLVVNPNDEEALKRVVNYPARGIGNTTMGKIQMAATKAGVSLWEVICNPSFYNTSISTATTSKLGAFRSLVTCFKDKVESEDAFTLTRSLLAESGMMKDIYEGKDAEDVARQENIDEFLNSIMMFVDTRREEQDSPSVSVADFLQEVALLTDLESDDGKQSKVSLMTVHAAKGLEFSTVFIVGMEENIFPSQMSSDSPRALEEERRLFYVAITRAKRHCILTNAKSRLRYGHMEFDQPSRFLADIDSSLMTIGKGRGIQNSRPVASQFKADVMPKITSSNHVEKPIDPFSPSFRKLLSNSGGGSSLKVALVVGDRIEHQRFGLGTVTAVEGTGENAKATVDFEIVGVKQLLLKFAKYKKV